MVSSRRSRGWAGDVAQTLDTDLTPANLSVLPCPVEMSVSPAQGWSKVACLCGPARGEHAVMGGCP